MSKRRDDQASAEREADYRRQVNQSFERLYLKTKNPLYAWEALDHCLQYQDPIPEWVLKYLSKTASAITNLAQRSTDPSKDAPFGLTPKQAVDLVPQALGIVPGPRQKNAFKRRTDESLAIYAQLSDDALAYVKKKANVEDDRAARIIRGGKKLLA